MNPDLYAYIAGTLTTACFIPQAWKIITTKNVEGISAIMYLAFTIGVAFWLIYGFALARPPMIIFNAVTLVLAIIILYNVIRYRKK